ncbi:SDR family oxidoreductase [Hoyosella rhizosphaerae]|uniref:Hypothetical short-chain dehydrogenase/reductase n=1 Tax=Hoyosella rhizosphaerae TaxID=1755582 RepID=A0A916X953_9ACTN|nr:SDR family oxidoreductase [Hoyosella rhizosphaerae]MBN4926850.1 SDR family oxidoreductase [Hoyosella rhizosphaerae]GGC56035.1 hypothetical short-chain dehydrogenase/reductase [Hoyosella rhizosphaerae]
MAKKSIIVVGAGPGVGYETAERFANEGFAVGLIRRDIHQLEPFADKLRAQGRTVHGVSADAADPESLGAAIVQLGDALGGIDVLLYNVPGPLGEAYGPALDIDLNALQEFLTLRVVSVLASVQAARPHLLAGRGSVLITSGQSDRNSFPGTGLIGAPQAALRMLARHMHAELSEHGVYVGYVPLDNPPLYSNPELESQRTDLPEGFSLPARVIASDVADKLYELTRTRNAFELAVHAKEL